MASGCNSEADRFMMYVDKYIAFYETPFASLKHLTYHRAGIVTVKAWFRSLQLRKKDSHWPTIDVFEKMNYACLELHSTATQNHT
jgi:hypothetical protein